ncbi:lipopolysaccharide biosynthesis protein [Nocardia cyriacigeorgica]|uniref:Lipopolysaccharide biosynthesis protein n=1 Tax=Nocardia cyriacigeorgica TaxID=135487 RepID=A0A5R8NMI1_9NOCA|nr:oligosaccharide flippase family protein [Nocardia cyriacigeorgica]TLF76889.1 lipopolysaccharide biosynthesis protein [Nocardia cyriacigeorgica]
MRDIGYVSFGKYGQYLITLLTLPLIARILGADGVGLLAIGMSSYFIGSLLVDLGITPFLAARVHDIRTTRADLGELRGAYLAIRATTLAALAAMLVAGTAVQVPAPVQMILLGLFTGGFWSISEDWLLIGQGRFGTSTVYQGAGRIGYLVLLILLLPRFPSAPVVLLCMLVSSVLTVALTWWDSVRTFGTPPRPRNVRAVLRIGGPILTSRALVSSYGQGSVAIYAAVLDAVSLGLYSAGDRLVRAIQSLLDPIGFALLPRMARRSTQGTFWRSSVRSLLVCVCAAVLAVAGVWLLAPLLIHVIFGDQFTGAVALLRVEVFILPATTVTSFVTTAVLPVRQDTAGVLIGAIVGTCVALIALGIALHTRSVWTLVFGSLAAEVAVALWCLVRMRWLVLRDRAAALRPAPAADLILDGGSP